jgi:hypothetical protein
MSNNGYMIGAVSGKFNTEKSLIVCAEYIHRYVSEIKEVTTDCSAGSD